jgi:hypothetical protein
MSPNAPALRTARGRLLAVGAAAALSACYVVPMNPDGSPAWQYLPPAAGTSLPATGPVVVAPSVPAGPPVPVIYQARLYPMNEQAARTGQLTATITDLNTGRGVLTMTLGGEYLSGEATRVSDAHPGFGTVYQKVLNTPIRVQPGQPKGIANATGSRGTWVNCEYVLERGGRGTGACLMSDGAAYQIHFGG